MLWKVRYEDTDDYEDRYAEVDQVGIRKFGTSWVVGIHIDRTEYCGGGMAVATFAMVRRQR